MLKFACQTTDNQIDKGGFGSAKPNRLEREMLMVALEYAVENSQLKQQPPASMYGTAAIPAVSLEDCISAAHQLLSLLQEETEALKGFQCEALLPLLTRKDTLIKDISVKIGRFRSSPEPSARTDVHPEAEYAHACPQADSMLSGKQDKRVILRNLLREIERCNDTNRVFIEGSLNYWQDLLNLILPGTYTLDQDGQAARQTVISKGLALNKEI
jgi:hypothetical protein